MATSSGDVREHTVSDRTILRVIGWLLLAVAGVWVLLRLAPVLVLIVTAMFLAAALDPAVRWLQRRRLPRPFAVTVVALGLLGIVAGIALVVGPALAEQGSIVIDRAPGYLRDIEQFAPVERAQERYGLVDRLRSGASSTAAGAAGQASEAFALVLGGLATAVTGLLLTLIMLAGGPAATRSIVAAFPEVARGTTWRIIVRTYHNVSRFLIGSIIMSSIAATSLFVLLLVLGVEAPLALAAWMLLFAIVPIVGAPVGAIPALLVGFGSSLVTGLVILGYLIVYQQLESGVLAPRILGTAVNISTLGVFLAIIIGGSLLGVIGVLLAVPLAGTLAYLLAQVQDQRLREQPTRTRDAVDRVEG